MIQKAHAHTHKYFYPERTKKKIRKMRKIVNAIDEPLTFTAIKDRTRLSKSTLHDRLEEMLKFNLVEKKLIDSYGTSFDVYEIPYPKEEFLFHVLWNMDILYRMVYRGKNFAKAKKPNKEETCGRRIMDKFLDWLKKEEEKIPELKDLEERKKFYLKVAIEFEKVLKKNNH